MPFSTLTEFEHTREVKQKERNPGNVGRKSGKKSVVVERNLQTVFRKCQLTERTGIPLKLEEKGREKKSNAE